MCFPFTRSMLRQGSTAKLFQAMPVYSCYGYCFPLLVLIIHYSQHVNTYLVVYAVSLQRIDKPLHICAQLTIAAKAYSQC